MTRDEAIAREMRFSREAAVILRSGATDDVLRELATSNVDRFAALGMLTLDEPKSARHLAVDTLFKKFGGNDIKTMLDLLDKADLRIVEK